MNYKFLLIGANKENSTDGVIVKGIFNILENVFKNHEKKYLFLEDAIKMTDNEFFIDEKFDAIFVCGTPWLWDSFQNSTKYDNVYRLFKSHPEAKQIFLGAGSCMHIESINSNILKRPDEIQGIKKLYEKALVISRDKLAHSLFENAGIKSIFLPCPAYFCYGIDNIKYGTKTENVLIWCDPKLTISANGWSNTEKLNKYYNTCKYFFVRTRAKVYCALKSEVNSAIKIGIGKPIVLTGYEHTLSVMQKAKTVLSGRVHCAVPAFVQGCNLGVLQIDSRCHVLKDFNCKIIQDQSDLSFLKRNKIDLKKYFEIYKNNLEKFIIN